MTLSFFSGDGDGDRCDDGDLRWLQEAGTADLLR
jgi:hypothetical protein